MVSGHLEIKKNYYYAVLNYKDGNGNRKRKWLSTGIPARKGNTRKAQAELAKLQAAFMTEFEAMICFLRCFTAIIWKNGWR